MADMPQHIAFIMDGNGRWATARGLKRSQGHQQGVNTAVKVVDWCIEKTIRYVSFFVFSTENWKRPKSEIECLFTLAEKYLDKYSEDKRVRVTFSGSTASLPRELVAKISRVVSATALNNQCTVNLCINYGGRAEVVSVAKALCESGKKITLATFEKQLYAGLPPVDYIVRTGGEKRLSNFMLYQGAYAELHFIDCYWPDFEKSAFEDCITEYTRRKRNFGGI